MVQTQVFALALIAGAAVAQAPPNGNSLPPPAKVVALNVIAHDSNNQSVGDLGTDDFRVTDQGNQQKIIFFHRNEDAARLAPAGPGEYSNRSGEAAPHALAILFDLMNTDLSYRGFGTDEIVRAVEHLQVAGEVYLYLLMNSGMLLPGARASGVRRRHSRGERRVGAAGQASARCSDKGRERGEDQPGTTAGGSG